MNKYNWFLIISIIGTLSSCITAAQFNNAEDDAYYSPKASNKKQPVMIPEVDVDQIIKDNPPQYGNPINKIDDDNNTNPLAAQYYPSYRAQQDSMVQQNPRYSTGYVDPSLATNTQSQEADKLRNMYGNNYNNATSNWNVGAGMSFWGPTISVGYGNYNNGYYGNNYYGNGYYGYNNYSPWGYNNYYNPWNSGYGYNNMYSPWYGGFGYGGYGYGYNSFYSSRYGGGYYNPWSGNNGGYYNGDNGNNNNSNTGNQPMSRPRQSVGNNNPPDNGGRNSVNYAPSNNGGRYIAPPTQNQVAQPIKPANQSIGKGRSNYTPASPQQTLENVNGRQIYTRPAETVQQAQPNNNNNATFFKNNGGRSSSQGDNRMQRSQGTNNSQSSPNSNGFSSPSLSTPSNGSRGSSGGNGGGRGSSGSGGSGGGGRRR